MNIPIKPSPSASVSGRSSVIFSRAGVPANATDYVMEESTVSFRQLATTSKHFARRLLTIGENRLELLTVEVQEERERLLHAFLLALGVAAFGLLAGLTLTAAIVVLLWAWSPLAVLSDFDRPLRRCRDLSLPAAHRRDAQLADAFRLA